MDDPTRSTADLDDDPFDALLKALAHVSHLPLDALHPRPQPAPGEVIDEHLELLHPLGEGGMGVVFAARDLRLGRRVAVKLLRLDARSPRQRQDALRAFERDGAATARLQHPGVVTVHHLGVWRQVPFLVLELLHGRELAQLLRERRLTPREVLRFGLQIASALDHAHTQGVIHRDLSSRNIFVLDDGQLKILDFGLAALQAHADHPDASTPPPLRAGTPAYMAPEQWRGLPQDARCDLWALGVLLYEATCGDLPFHHLPQDLLRDPAPPRPSDHPDASTHLLDDLITRLLQTDPERRLPTARLAIDALRDAEAHLLGGPAAERDPFRFLDPFDEDDAPWFFGRDRELGRLLALATSHPLAALVGPSGAGKTSLLRAGLAAHLREQRPAPLLLTLRPGPQPLHALANALRALPDPPSPSDLLRAPGAAGAALRAHAPPGGAWLLIDQLEELYTHGAAPPEQAAFASALAAVADDPRGPLRVVLTLRDDHLHRLNAHPDLRDLALAALLPLGPPPEDALRDALTRPPERLGYRLEDGLDHDLLRDLLQHPLPLPLLQLAASHLWQRRDTARKLLRRDDLRDLGGVPGILAAHAEAALDALDALDPRGGRDLARDLLTRLVTPSGARRALPPARLLDHHPDPARAARALEHLTQARLLARTRDPHGAPALELAHDALLTAWPRLLRWLQEGRDERLLLRALEDAALHWEAARRPDGLLWRGPHLDALLASLHRLELPTPTRPFVLAAERLQRRTRRLRRAASLAALLTALAVASGAAVALLEIDAQRQRAEESAQRAIAQRQRAQRAQRQAEELAESMLSDLSDALVPLGRLDLLERIAYSVQRYLDATPHPDGDDLASALRQRAVTLRLLGELAQSRGELATAEARYRESLRTLHDLPPEHLDTPRLQREVATTSRRLGNALAERGDFAGARDAFQQALDAILPAASAWGAEPRALEELALSFYALGNLDLEQHLLDDAADRYAEGQRLYLRLTTRAPHQPEWRRGLAVSYEKLGDVEQARQRSPQAEALYRTGLEHARDVANTDPRNVAWRRDVAVLYERLGDACMDQGRFDESVNLHKQSLDIVRPIADLDPQNAAWQRDLAISHEKIGEAYHALDRPQDALDAYAQSLVITRRLASADPHNALWQRDLAITLERMGRFLDQLERHDEADAHLREAEALRRRLVQDDAPHAPWRLELANLLRQRAEHHAARGRDDDARRALLEARDLLLHLLQQREDPDIRLILAMTEMDLSSIKTTPTDERRQRQRDALQHLQHLHQRHLLSEDDQRLMAALARDLGLLP